VLLVRYLLDPSATYGRLGLPDERVHMEVRNLGLVANRSAFGARPFVSASPMTSRCWCRFGGQG
jgi:hypothetical protein